jgi:hypothetical protein
MQYPEYKIPHAMKSELAHREIIRVFLGFTTPLIVSCLHELNVSKDHKITFQLLFTPLSLFSLYYYNPTPSSITCLSLLSFFAVSSNFFNCIGSFSVPQVLQFLFLCNHA